MALAKPINLRVRPLQSVDLCFPVDGVIGEQKEINLLGKTVQPIDLPNDIFSILGQTLPPIVLSPPPPAPPLTTGASRLKFDSAAIKTQLDKAGTTTTAPSILFELRADSIRAELDKAIAQRENSFLQKFSDLTNVIKTLQDAAAAKEQNLKDLIQASKDQHDVLNPLYAADFGIVTDTSGLKGVVKETLSKTTNTSHPVTVSTSIGSSATPAKPATPTTPAVPATPATPSDQNTTQTPAQAMTDLQVGGSITTSRGYDYRHPGKENDAQFYRSQVSLGDEKLAQFLSSRNRNFLATVFENDRVSMDLDIKKLQLAYISTILVSPISGLVTGVFRNKGDSVRAGQPVVRVENDEKVLLVGTIKFRGLISVGSSVTVTTQIFDSPQLLNVSGSVVAVRGHDSEDEQWEVLILCGNRAGGKPILPINYNFDFDDTTIDIV